MTPEESYQFSLIEARNAKLEAENQRLQVYEDFDKTYAGHVCDLIHEIVPALRAAQEVLQAFQPGDSQILGEMLSFYKFYNQTKKDEMKIDALTRLKAAAERLES